MPLSLKSGRYRRETISPLDILPPFNHSCNNRGKIESSQPLGRALFSVHSSSDSITDWSREGGGVGYTYSYPKHLLLRVTKDHNFTGLCLVIPISPYLYPCLYPVSVQKPGINPLRTTPPLSPNIARSSLNQIHNGLETLCKKKCPKRRKEVK